MVLVDFLGSDRVVGVEEDAALAADVLLGHAVADASDAAQRAGIKRWKVRVFYKGNER